jgi:hypothetical protein
MFSSISVKVKLKRRTILCGIHSIRYYPKYILVSPHLQDSWDELNHQASSSFQDGWEVEELAV